MKNLRSRGDRRFNIGQTGVSVAEALEDHRGVVATEAEIVGQGVFGLQFAGLIGYIVQIAVRIRGLVIDGRRDHAVLESVDAGNGFKATSRAQVWPVMPLVLLTANL